MPRIDFIGAVGVGKSTYFRALLRERPATRPWLTKQEARQAIAAKILRHQGTLSTRLKLAALAIPWMRRHIVNPLMEHYCDQVAWNRPDRWGKFLLECQQFTADDPVEAMRMALGTSRLCRRIQEIAMGEFYLADRTIVFDESIYHATLAIVAPSRQGGAGTETRRLYESLPLPAGVIHLTANRELICERLMAREEKRKRRVLSICHLPDEAVPERIGSQLQSIEVAISVIKQSGVPVLTIDSSEDLPSQPARLAHFVSEVTTEPYSVSKREWVPVTAEGT